VDGRPNHTLAKPVPNLVWFFNECAENNPLILVGKESYYISGDGFLMPVKKGKSHRIRDISNRPGNSALEGAAAKGTVRLLPWCKNACYWRPAPSLSVSCLGAMVSMSARVLRHADVVRIAEAWNRFPRLVKYAEPSRRWLRHNPSVRTALEGDAPAARDGNSATDIREISTWIVTVR